jgi:hypothetical protein
MRETQGYKNDQEFTLPTIGAPYLRSLVRQRLDTVTTVLEDPNAPKCFTKDALVSLSFEALQLAKMLDRMPHREKANA